MLNKFYSLAAVSAYTASAFSNIPIGNNQHHGTFSYLAAENMAVITLNADDCANLNYRLSFYDHPVPFTALYGEDNPANPASVCVAHQNNQNVFGVNGFTQTSAGKCTSVTVLESDLAEADVYHPFASFNLYNENELMCGNLVSGDLKSNSDNTVFSTRDKSEYAFYTGDAVSPRFSAFTKKGCRGVEFSKAIPVNSDSDWTYFAGAKNNGKVFKSVQIDDRCVELRTKFGASARHVSLDYGQDLGVNLEFSQNSIFEPTHYHASFDCPALDAYTTRTAIGGYHIHVKQIEGDEATQRNDSECGNTGGHWNPYGADYKIMTNPVTDFEFEIGDNAKRYGNIADLCAVNDQVEVNAWDWNFPLFGAYNFNERSVVFHAKEGGARVACRNLSEN